MAEQTPWVIAEPRHGVVGVIVWAVFLGAAAAGLAATVSLRRRGVPGRRAYWFIGFLVMAVQWELIADLSGWGGVRGRFARCGIRRGHRIGDLDSLGHPPSLLSPELSKPHGCFWR